MNKIPISAIRIADHHSPSAQSFWRLGSRHVRSYYNVSWVAIFNAAGPNNFSGDLDTALWSALAGITS